MRSSESNVRTNISSEVHASLRRLEDANYVTESLLRLKIAEVDERLTSAIETVEREFEQLHKYIAPHIKNGDLQFFQQIYIGNIQVDGGGVLGGAITISNAFSVGTTSGFDAHKLTIDNTEATGSPKILATADINFSLAGLIATPSWSGGTYRVRAKNTNAVLASTTIRVKPHIVYDSNSKKHYAWAEVFNEKNNAVLSDDDDKVWSDVLAYSNRVTFDYYGTGPGGGYLYYTSTNLGTGSHYLYH